MNNQSLLQLPRYKCWPRYANGQQVFHLHDRNYVGVSTILKATEPLEVQAQLAAWRSRVGAEEAQRIIRASINRGKRLHRLVENHLLQSQGTEATPESWGYWQSLQPLLSEITDVYLVEGLVWHPYGFAGVTDALLAYQGQMYVCDWTTSPKPKQWAWIQNKCLQVAAYAAAINRVYQSYGVRVNQAQIVIALPDTDAQVFRLEPSQLMDFWHQFQDRLAEYKKLCAIPTY